MYTASNVGGYFMVNKFVLPFIIGMMSVFGVGSIFGNRGTTVKTYQNESTVERSVKNVASETARDYSGETDVEEGKLTISTTSSTLTSMGQSFSFTFATGGQGWQDTTKTYLLAPDDAEFSEYYANFLQLTVEEREEIAEKYENGEYEPVHFNSYVFRINGTANTHDIYIPRSLTRNHIFNLDVTRMDINVVPDWTNINSITIPVEISEIYSETFQDVPAGMVFNVEAESKPENWADDWNHGATVNYGVEIPPAKQEPLSTAGAEKYGDTKQNYIIGWYPKEGEQQPLTLEYKTKNANGELSESKYFDFQPTSDKSTYECVGFELIDYTKILYCDIPLNEGEEVDFSSLMIHNIYRAKTNTAGASIAEPDLATAYRLAPKQAFAKTYTIDDFLHIKYEGLSTFSGFTSLDLNIDVSDANVYKDLKSNYYNSHLKDLESGKLHIRYRLTSLTLCKFRVTYVSGGEERTDEIKIVTPVPQFKIEKQKNNRVSFLFRNGAIGNGFSAKSIRSVSMVGLFVAVDLMGDKSTVARSQAITRFGFMSIMPHTPNPSVFDVNAMLILMGVIYVVAYVGAGVGLYFFLKNKYKNDEFRRMKTKSYIKKAGLGLGGSLIVLFAIVFIIIRNTAMNNAIVTFNPVDAYIIILSVLSVVIIGYFIKYLVGAIKTNKERRRIIKLKLNEDVEDDGTN